MPKVLKVKNKATGIIHTVLEGHWSLSNDDYVVMKKQPAKKKATNGGKK